MQPRSKLRANSTVDQWIRCSLQSCSNPDDCFVLLTSIESQSRSERVKNKIHGLSEVLKHLYMPEICNGYRQNRADGFLSFEEAYEIYSGHQTTPVDNTEFRDILLHPVHGLPVYIVSLGHHPHRIIILKSADVNNSKLVSVALQRSEKVFEITQEKELQPDVMELIISSMDSEWDKECAKLLLSYGKTRGELSHLCFNVDKLLSKKSDLINVATEISQNKMSARDLVIARLQEKEQGLNNNILQKEAAIQQFGQSWPLYVKEDKQTEIEVLKDQLANVKEIQVKM